MSYTSQAFRFSLLCAFPVHMPHPVLIEFISSVLSHRISLYFIFLGINQLLLLDVENIFSHTGKSFTFRSSLVVQWVGFGVLNATAWVGCPARELLKKKRKNSHLGFNLSGVHLCDIDKNQFVFLHTRASFPNIFHLFP